MPPLLVLRACRTAAIPSPMHLSLHTDYGLRVLMLLAAADRLMSVDEIARSYGISHNHLAKVAQRLQALGHIETVRGRSGGLRLAVRPEDLKIGTVVRQMENIDSFVECLAGTGNTCRAVGACGLQGALSLALHDFLQRLDGYTLADVLPKKNLFLTRLGLGEQAACED